MCVIVIYFLLVKLIIFFLLFYIYILLPVMVNKDFQRGGNQMQKHIKTYYPILNQLRNSKKKSLVTQNFNAS